MWVEPRYEPASRDLERRVDCGKQLSLRDHSTIIVAKAEDFERTTPPAWRSVAIVELGRFEAVVQCWIAVSGDRVAGRCVNDLAVTDDGFELHEDAVKAVSASDRIEGERQLDSIGALRSLEPASVVARTVHSDSVVIDRQ